MKSMTLPASQDSSTSNTAGDVTATAIPTGFKLRGYQQDAIDACLKALKEGLTRIGVSSPTGSGKTLMFASLIPHFLPLGSKYRSNKSRVLILVGSEELADQAQAKIREVHRGQYFTGREQGPYRCFPIDDM
jgi:ATP-dependent helicase IRC3